MVDTEHRRLFTEYFVARRDTVRRTAYPLLRRPEETLAFWRALGFAVTYNR